MFTIYETSPRYCTVTDALVGVTYRPLATVATREEARAYAHRWVADEGPDTEVGLDLHGPDGRSTWWEETPAPYRAEVNEDDLPF
jgi:hypothetical protein